jgi:hypothetical protein
LFSKYAAAPLVSKRGARGKIRTHEKETMTRKRYALIYGSLIWGGIGGMTSLLIRKVFFGHPLDMLNIITMLILAPVVGYVWGNFAYFYYEKKHKKNQFEYCLKRKQK